MEQEFEGTYKIETSSEQEKSHERHTERPKRVDRDRGTETEKQRTGQDMVMIQWVGRGLYVIAR